MLRRHASEIRESDTTRPPRVDDDDAAALPHERKARRRILRTWRWRLPLLCIVPLAPVLWHVRVYLEKQSKLPHLSSSIDGRRRPHGSHPTGSSLELASNSDRSGNKIRRLGKGRRRAVKASSGTILIAVVSSREQFGSRAATVSETWANEASLPGDVTVRYFVGRASDDEEGEEVIVSGSSEDIKTLAKRANITDLASIVVMKNVKDDEYPPVRKNAAMIRRVEAMMRESDDEEDGAGGYDWVFKVDDDTYVNVDALRNFVASKDPTVVQVFGRSGLGRMKDRPFLKRAGLLKPFCMGGPGYVMSRPTLNKVAAGMDGCVDKAERSDHRNSLWHSDVVIGMCIQGTTGVGCAENMPGGLGTGPFTKRYGEREDYLDGSKLGETVSMHPFKEGGAMKRQHERFAAALSR